MGWHPTVLPMCSNVAIHIQHQQLQEPARGGGGATTALLQPLLKLSQQRFRSLLRQQAEVHKGDVAAVPFPPSPGSPKCCLVSGSVDAHYKDTARTAGESPLLEMTVSVGQVMCVIKCTLQCAGCNRLLFAPSVTGTSTVLNILCALWVQGVSPMIQTLRQVVNI